MFTTILVIASILGFFLPYLIANSRRLKASDGILLTNFLLGWTVLGWIVALIWSVSAQDKRS